jgi:hypothetical protein
VHEEMQILINLLRKEGLNTIYSADDFEVPVQKVSKGRFYPSIYEYNLMPCTSTLLNVRGAW